MALEINDTNNATLGSYPTDATTNRLSGLSYDANGNQGTVNMSGTYTNLTYDVANRIDEFV